MQVGLFLENKLRRQLAMNGRKFDFQQIGEDQYHQKNQIVRQYTIDGIFHESTSYIKSADKEGSRLTSKPQPMILTLKSEADKVSKDDILLLNDVKYIVVAKHDVNNLNIACDISLEVVL